MIRTLARPGREMKLIELGVAELNDGEKLNLSGDKETVVVILSGRVRAEVRGEDLGVAGGRIDVFAAPGHAVYAPPGSPLSLSSEEHSFLAVTTAPLDGGEPGPARIIHPEDQRIARVGEGNWSRSVRTILGPEHEAGRLLIGETINPPGNWSSYPPHKHDQHDPPEEVQLEEIYLFKMKPKDGFGVQIRYHDRESEAFMVHDGDTATIPYGYHPVVAAPGYELYYLWVMAGKGRAMVPRFDPLHAWVQEGS